MKKFSIRLPAVLLILAMLLCCFAGCKQDEGGMLESSDVTQNTDDTDEKTENEDQEADRQEDLPLTDSEKEESPGDNKKPSEDKQEENEQQKPDSSDKNEPVNKPSGGNGNNTPVQPENNENNNQTNNNDTNNNNSNDNNTQQPSETPDEEDDGDSDGDEIEDGAVEGGSLNTQEPIIVKPIPKPAGYEDYMTVVSFNIKCAMYSATWNKVVGQLKSINADIVGLQECDFNTTRSGPGNQVKKLAEDAGYRYWYFAKTIDHRGGEYGHGILSKYPISNSEVTFFKSQSGETRNVERHEIEIDGKTLVFYNTHLNGTVNQYREIHNMMIKDKYAVLTGDLNFEPIKLEGWMDADVFLALNGGPTLKHKVKTTSGSCIDNIIVTKNTIDYWFDEKAQTGITVHKSDASDHNMIYGYIKLK